MPTNLPPEYFEAETRYREASSPREKLETLEALISTIPKHKGTDKLRADLRRKLSKLRDEGAKRKKGGRGDLYTVEHQGAGQVALVGFANAGKSALVGALTNARPVVAEYPMSTVMPLAAMMPFEDIQFQMVDLPPVGNESTDGWVSGIVRTADMLLVILDLPDAPDVQAELLLEQLRAWRIPVLRSGEEPLRVEAMWAKPLVVIGNKADLAGAEEGLEVLRATYGREYPVLGVSAASGLGIEALRRAVFEHARVIRVYSKEPGKEPRKDQPFTLRSGSTVMDLAEQVHKDFVAHLKFACIWGSAKFDGQKVQRDHRLNDRDVV